jgi:hypothetical protein
MNDPDEHLDSLFERDADARLLDRRRSDELGLAPLMRPASSTPARFGAESMLADNGAAFQRGPVLRVAAEARPNRDLIPGAIATVVLSVWNDGDIELASATLRATATAEAEFVPGTLAVNAVAPAGAELFGEGIVVGPIAPHEAVGVRFALRILSGTAPIDVHADVRAAGVPAVAPPSLRLTRRASHVAYEKPRPFYELEIDEADAELPSVSPAVPIIDTVLDAPAAPPVLRAAPLPPVPPATAAAGAFILARQIEADEVRALERVFLGAVPHGLSALALLTSIGAADGPLGEAVGTSEFVRAVAAALPRALVAARIGRPTPPVVTASALDAIRAAADARPTPFAATSPTLTARLDERELNALRAVLGRALDDPFLRGVQILLAVAPRALEGAGATAAGSIRDALAAYRVTASAWLMRVTVRRAVDHRFDPVTADDQSLHDGGKTLVAALREALR